MKSEDLILELSALAVKQNLPTPTLEQVEAALVTKDLPEAKRLWRNRIETKMWDGVSDINSANAAYIRESNPWLDVVYVLLIDGAVTYMQTHEPFSEGHIPITLETVDEVSNKHADFIAENNAKFEIFEQVAKELGL